jgi:hypothetical protein
MQVAATRAAAEVFSGETPLSLEDAIWLISMTRSVIKTIAVFKAAAARGTLSRAMMENVYEELYPCQGND